MVLCIWVSVLAGDVVSCDRSLERGGGGVVALLHLGSRALLEDQLLLSQEVVRVGHVELPNLVEDRQLCGGVEAQVADELADVGPVLLLDVGLRRSCCLGAIA
jgi:hypothetical protein